MNRGSEHFTITEAHPYHGPNNTIAADPKCPKCREGSCHACGFYKRGQDGRCVNCGRDWPLANENPSPEVTDAGSLTQE